MKRLSLILGTLLLAGALAVPFLPRPQTLPGRGVHLAKTLPRDLSGWTSVELTLGDTEADQGSVEKTLRYDDVFYREYRSARGKVTLYVAYWAPAKMPTQLVASHTPDRCWSSAGWQCQEIIHQEPLTAGPVTLRPGERRQFQAPNGAVMHVQYWHLVGRNLYDYGDRFNRTPSLWRWWRDAAKQAYQAPPEQYFVRVAGDRTLLEFQGDKGWQELLAALGRLGLGVMEPATGAQAR